MEEEVLVSLSVWFWFQPLLQQALSNHRLIEIKAAVQPFLFSSCIQKVSKYNNAGPIVEKMEVAFVIISMKDHTLVQHYFMVCLAP